MLTLRRWTEFGMLLLALACLLLAVRFLMLGVGAAADNGFTRLVLALSYPLVAPFLTLFGGNGGQLEFPSLIAIAFYLLMGWVLTWLLRTAISPRRVFRA